MVDAFDGVYWRVTTCSSLNTSLLNGISLGRLGEPRSEVRSFPLQVVRAGPWSPRVCTPVGSHSLVFNEDGRRFLLSEARQPVSFVPVKKVRVVDINVEYWTPECELGNGVEGVEPDEYLLHAGVHSYWAAEEMGPLWELYLYCGCLVSFEGDPDAWSYRVDRSSITGWDFCFGAMLDGTVSGVLVSSFGRSLLERLDTVGALDFEACTLG